MHALRAIQEPFGQAERCAHRITVWALDFPVRSKPVTPGVLKYLNITDEFSRQALAIEVERSMSGDDIVTILEALINVHVAPECRADG